MNRMVIIAVVVLLLIGVAGAGAFYMMQNKSTSVSTPTNTSSQTEMTVEVSPTSARVMDKKSLILSSNLKSVCSKNKTSETTDGILFKVSKL